MCRKFCLFDLFIPQSEMTSALYYAVILQKCYLTLFYFRELVHNTIDLL